ncbi:hypothetical protein KSF_077780 [Reticulibacter mediterranei]|uniref:Uncharacterized protein n=1 Tax=Reticulibacter mediterranei TaxID=2778369 RepID=A0A8J3ISI1_9CHLR|nr:hypothetical protein [Reticulibacter mediterranei]GHO97730.1 hypothetical protein KSF_077780 [Reticulibacter mediterranei]
MSPHRIEGNRSASRRGDERSPSPNGNFENDGRRPNTPPEQPQSTFEPLRPNQRRDTPPNHPFDATFLNGELGQNGELRQGTPPNHPFDATFLNGELGQVNGDVTFSHDAQQDVSPGGVAQGQERLTQRRSFDDGILSNIEYYGQVQGRERLVQQWYFDDEGSVERIIVFNNQLPGPPAAHEWIFHAYEEFPNIQLHDNANNTSYDYRTDNHERVYQLHQLVFNGNFEALIRQYYPHILADEQDESNRDQITTQLHSLIRLAVLRQHEQGVFEGLIREHPIFEHLLEYRVYQVDEQLFRITSRNRFGIVLRSHAFRHNGDEVEPGDVS